MSSPSSSTASKSAEDVHALVARIYQALRTPFDCHGHQLTSDASIGVAIAPRHGSDLFDLLKNADLAMYAAKAAGRRTYRFFDPSMEQEAKLRRELEADLRAALAQGGSSSTISRWSTCAATKSPAARPCCAGGIRCAGWFRPPTSCPSPRKPA